MCIVLNLYILFIDFWVCGISFDSSLCEIVQRSGYSNAYYNSIILHIRN
uniref:G-protein coupled receptors family 1 profile domain-containing protein n=1 Tax=Anguilla anguilla TaxID=7936 RepID=A0A0E9WH32_ANGAN